MTNKKINLTEVKKISFELFLKNWKRCLMRQLIPERSSAIILFFTLGFINLFWSDLNDLSW